MKTLNINTISVFLNGQKLKMARNESSFYGSGTVWYFDPADRRGIVHIKTSPLSTDVNTALSVKYE
jgi:hypothetical protein